MSSDHFARSVLALLFTGVPTMALAENVQTSWHLLVGAGSSHPGWGKTKERVEMRDLIVRHERPQNRLRGSGWYRNRRAIQVEFPLHYLPDYPGSPMMGVVINSKWSFVANNSVTPYLFAGGGGLYTEADIPGTSSELKGVYQAGAGVQLDRGRLQYSFEIRYHHLSNGGVSEPNDPLNSSRLLFGINLPLPE